MFELFKRVMGLGVKVIDIADTLADGANSLANTTKLGCEVLETEITIELNDARSRAKPKKS
jgi:hypothetical protein